MQALGAKVNAPSALRPAVGRQLRVVVSAKYKGELVQKVTKLGGDKAAGFRWDPSMQRWLKDARVEAVKDMKVTPWQGSPYTVWPIIHSELMSKGLKGVDAEKAAKMQSQGWTLVDVRLEGDFDNAHAEGAVNVPLFRLVQGNELWDNIKKAVMAGLAMAATERDPDYMDTALSKLKKNQKIIVMCAIGGTLDTVLRLRPEKYKNGIQDPERNFGRESRSLKAAHEFLYKGGWSANNVVFLEGGYQQWRYQGFPVESE